MPRVVDERIERILARLDPDDRAWLLERAARIAALRALIRRARLCQGAGNTSRMRG